MFKRRLEMENCRKWGQIVGALNAKLRSYAIVQEGPQMFAFWVFDYSFMGKMLPMCMLKDNSPKVWRLCISQAISSGDCLNSKQPPQKLELVYPLRLEEGFVSWPI